MIKGIIEIYCIMNIQGASIILVIGAPCNNL